MISRYRRKGRAGREQIERSPHLHATIEPSLATRRNSKMRKSMLRSLHAVGIIAGILTLPAVAGAETKKPVANFRNALAHSCSAARRVSGGELPASCLASAVTRRIITG